MGSWIRTAESVKMEDDWLLGRCHAGSTAMGKQQLLDLSSWTRQLGQHRKQHVNLTAKGGPRR